VDAAGEAVLDVVAEPVVLDEFRDLGSSGSTLRVPLGYRGLVLELPGPCGGVAAKLTRDRRGVPTHTPCDLPHAVALRFQQCDVLTLGERQIAARHHRSKTRVHTASVTEPPIPNRR
jgi:hypothetical protein